MVCSENHTRHSYLRTCYLLTYLLRGAEAFLRNEQVLGLLGNSSHFMEAEGSLPHSQEPATCACPESDGSSPRPSSHFPKIHFNIILPFTPGTSLFLQVSPPKPCMHFFCPPYVLHTLPTSVFLMCSPETVWTECRIF